MNLFSARRARRERSPYESSFYPQITHLVIPIILQNLLNAAVSSADVVMLNYVGQSSLSAVSLASQYANVLQMVFYGIGSGATMLCAQYYGKGDRRAIEIVEGIALRFSMLTALVFAVCAALIPQLMMRLFTNDPELISIGVSYLRFISVSYLCWSISEVYLSILRSTSQVAMSTAMNMLAFLLNVLLNAVFIFGLCGAPKLGAMGVAIATSISRLVQLIACLIVSASGKFIRLDFRFLFRKSKLLFQDFLQMSVPALANDVIWSVAFSMYSVIIGHMGSDAVAANAIVVVVRNCGTTLCFGFASAGGLLLGQVIGKNNLEEAEVYARKLVWLTVITGLIGGVVILIASPFILTNVSLTEQARYYLKYMLFINSYYVMGQAVNTTLICGVFRAGGDSRFGFICDTIDMWCYAVPLGFLAAFIFKLPFLWVYFLLCTDEFVKWPWVIAQYRKKLWLKNITRDNV